jgi:Leucine-rich repeat (LRR) protein
VTLSLRGALPVDDLSCWLSCVALGELSLQGTQVPNASFAGLGPLLARLHKLDLSECKQVQAISNLAPATSLRELTLADSDVIDLRGLDKLVAFFDDAGRDQHSHRGLVHPAAVPSTGHAVFRRGHHRTRK